jgi:DNA primase
MKLIKKLRIKVLEKPLNKFSPINNKGNIVRMYCDITGSTTKHMGRVEMALCPFHEERTPSFAMYPETSSYYCWSCAEAGDSLTLLMKLKHLTFAESLEEVKNYV